MNVSAIVLAIAAALATGYYTNEQDKPQYIPVNNSYQPAGEYGVDYNCHQADSICTYYALDSIEQPGEFAPARKGRYQAIQN